MFNKRYYSLDEYYKKRYGCKVFKVSLNLGLSCPNIDGVKGYGGCIYCKGGSSSNDGSLSLRAQFEREKEILHRKWKNAKYIAYFQNNSNTYGDLEYLKRSFEEVLGYDGVVGINIATRCDAISDECFSYLEDLNKRTDLVIELGLQTIHDETSKLINRGHSLDEFLVMYNRLKKAHIKVVVHIINGLCYESYDMMIDTAKFLNKIKPDGIKIHMLCVLKGTPLEKFYEKNKFHILSLDEYVNVVCSQLEYLDSSIVIHRITGDPYADDLICPSWVLKKFNVMNSIFKELKRRGTYQGFNTCILNRSRALMSSNLKSNDFVIDATIGNGKDSAFLLDIVRDGFLFGFDIQKVSIENTKKRLSHFSNYELFNTGHENIADVLSEYVGKISLIVFNLGYLPGGDKGITTKYDTTIKAISDSLLLLNGKGHIVVTLYTGHDNGLESDKVLKFLDDSGICYDEYHNTCDVGAPFVIDIRKS